MVVFPFTHAPVNNRTRFCNGALEAHHHPLAWSARSTGMRAVWQA